MSPREFEYLFQTMYTSQVKGYAHLDVPKGRRESVDCGKEHVTRLREFVEETGGLYHPDKFDGASLGPSLTEIRTDYEGQVYVCHYVVYIDDCDRLCRTVATGDTLLDFILQYIDSGASAKCVEGYRKRFKYNRVYDGMKRPHFVYLDETDVGDFLGPINRALLHNEVQNYLSKKK